MSRSKTNIAGLLVGATVIVGAGLALYFLFRGKEESTSSEAAITADRSESTSSDSSNILATISDPVRDFITQSTGITAESFVGENIQKLASSQNKEAGTFFRDIAAQATSEVRARILAGQSALSLSGSVPFVTSPSSPVQLEIKKPTIDESATSASKNKDINFGGTDSSVREVFRQSVAPTNVQLNFAPPGARTSAINAKPGTLSATKTPGTGKSAGTSKGGKK
jgi:hypothetical protein